MDFWVAFGTWLAAVIVGYTIVMKIRLPSDGGGPAPAIMLTPECRASRHADCSAPHATPDGVCYCLCDCHPEPRASWLLRPRTETAQGKTA